MTVLRKNLRRTESAPVLGAMVTASLARLCPRVQNLQFAVDAGNQQPFRLSPCHVCCDVFSGNVSLVALRKSMRLHQATHTVAVGCQAYYYQKVTQLLQMRDKSRPPFG